MAVTADLNNRRGLGLLARRNLAGLDTVLAGYAQAGLPDLFAERVLFFPVVTDEARAIAAAHGYRAEGTAQDEGRLAGFRALTAAMTTDVVVLVDQGSKLTADAGETNSQIEAATRLLLEERVQVVRLRSRAAPGATFDLPQKYRRYHGDGALPALRRRLRPGKAKRLAGGAVYVRDKADRAHRGLIDRSDDGTYLVSAACLAWTNHSVMVRRDFFLNRICAQGEATRARRRIVGRPSTDADWDAPAWRRSGWTVGVPLGLFTREPER